MDTTYVQALQGKVEAWDTWAEIRRCNPLTAISGDFRKRLLVERDAARVDSRLKARFLSYRLNRPSGDESEVLLTVGDWECVTAREVPEREGRPIVGVDLGGGRAWSAAVALYSNGRVEAKPESTEGRREDSGRGWGRWEGGGGSSVAAQGPSAAAAPNHRSPR